MQVNPVLKWPPGQLVRTASRAPRVLVVPSSSHVDVVTRRSLRPGRLPLLAFYLVTWLRAGELLGARRSGALDRGPDHREDRALQRGGSKDLGPASPGIDGLRRLVMARRELPQLPDDR